MGEDDGHTGMDGEHRLQLEMIAMLERAAAAGEASDEVRALAERLIDFTDVHFMSEQLLMRLAAYPDQRGHEAEHDRLMERLRGLQTAFDLNDSDVMVKEAATLRDLLLHHMATHDLLLSRRLAEARNSL